ncbi:MAG: hypothetical protein BYD32DRAFT_311950 [Podila humilis]|nr:MAG: hypothetical protein BYD32DRAFT_311950 [Podila humilis]
MGTNKPLPPCLALCLLFSVPGNGHCSHLLWCSSLSLFPSFSVCESTHPHSHLLCIIISALVSLNHLSFFSSPESKCVRVCGTKTVHISISRFPPFLSFSLLFLTYITHLLPPTTSISLHH